MLLHRISWGRGVEAGKTSGRKAGQGVQSPPGTNSSQERVLKSVPSSPSGRMRLEEDVGGHPGPGEGSSRLLSSSGGRGVTAWAAPSL